MKFIACIIVFPLLLNLSTQIPQFNNCSAEIIANFQGECELVTCDGNDVSRLSCGLVGCAGAFEYIAGDESKPYPDCCGKAICSTS